MFCVVLLDMKEPMHKLNDLLSDREDRLRRLNENKFYDFNVKQNALVTVLLYICNSQVYNIGVDRV